jgi:enamine deaminase RidA (YjgF/YER057c/UK114 family)
MSAVEERLEKMGLTLPPPVKFPAANRTAAVLSEGLLLLSGHGFGLPNLPGVRQRGKVGSEVSEQEGYATARAVALTMISTIKNVVGDLDKVTRVIRIVGLVNSAPNFERQSAVIDGASDLFYEAFGPEIGQHARAAIGVAELPQRFAVEIMGDFRVRV